MLARAFSRMAAMCVMARPVSTLRMVTLPQPQLIAAADRPAASIRAATYASAAGSLEEQIKSTVAADKVVIYSKSYCPFCSKTKMLFDSMGVPYNAIELDLMDGGDAVQATLLDMTGQRTVPNVWVAGSHLGGN